MDESAKRVISMKRRSSWSLKIMADRCYKLRWRRNTTIRNNKVRRCGPDIWQTGKQLNVYRNSNSMDGLRWPGYGTEFSGVGRLCISLVSVDKHGREHTGAYMN